MLDNSFELFDGDLGRREAGFEEVLVLEFSKSFVVELCLQSLEREGKVWEKEMNEMSHRSRSRIVMGLTENGDVNRLSTLVGGCSGNEKVWRGQSDKNG